MGEGMVRRDEKMSCVLYSKARATVSRYKLLYLVEKKVIQGVN